MTKVGRNDPCPCGSGKKYKACCLGKHAKDTLAQKLLMWGVVAVLVLGLVAGIMTYVRSGNSMAKPPDKVWSEEHQHFH